MEPDDVDEFARLFRGFLERMQQPEQAHESLVDRLRRHLGADPIELPVVGESYPAYDLANVHRALTARFAGPGRSLALLGVSGADRVHHSLSELLTLSARHNAFGPGPVDLQHEPISVDEEQECVGFGFFLGTDGPDRHAALLPFRFHRLPGLTRDDIVMPDGVLERIERQVVGVARHRVTLRRQGQHLLRGLLLYGPPGTGKTHTVRYMMSMLPEFTVVLLAGTSIQFISQACALARMLQPALVVLEDCDLVAEARDFRHGRENPLLFQVLNEMDGLADEADVAFLLTTNRADLLEPALSQRPGRVDLAVEIPLPDTGARRRLIELYGPALRLTDGELTAVAERIEGTTASFSKELVRRASVLAAERDVPAPEAADLDAAADELLSDQDTLTRRLLGGPHPDGDALPHVPGPARRPGIAPGWSMGSY